MKNPEYAIVDIETTGGNASGSRITEIAIIIHNGTSVIDRWETLINPEKDIPVAIFALTGINNELVRKSPIFDDVAEKIFQMLNNRIFVAHNVNFDYSFVRHQLDQAGFKWTAKKLCTVRAARKIKPGFASYSLGNLCHSLEITLENRHRAGGDADATAILFALLLASDTENEIEKMVKRNAQDQRLPPNLPPEDFNKLPEKPGVYYFYNQAKKVIYVGKAINLKKRVASHFSGHSVKAQRQHFLRDIHGISFEVCATELMALLLECAEIKKLWPTYNSALKRFEPKFGLYDYEARSGYRYLVMGKIGKNQPCIKSFGSVYQGLNVLRALAEQFNIDSRYCKYGIGDAEIFVTDKITEVPEIGYHNGQIGNAIDFVLEEKPSYAIIDKGRTNDEKSCIWVENDHFYGMGYIPLDIGFSEPSEIKNHVTPFKSNQYMMQLIQAYAEKHPSKIRFKENTTIEISE